MDVKETISGFLVIRRTKEGHVILSIALVLLKVEGQIKHLRTVLCLRVGVVPPEHQVVLLVMEGPVGLNHKP